MERLLIQLVNLQKSIEIAEGTLLSSLAKEIEPELGFLAVNARINNLTYPLDKRIHHSCAIEFVGMKEESGLRTYLRSLSFVFAKAIRDLLPQYHLSVLHALAGGYFCRISNGGSRITDEQLTQIQRRIDELIAADLPFESVTVPAEEAIEVFRASGQLDKVDLITSSGEPYVTYHMLDGYPDNYYGSLLPSTGMIYLYDIIPYLGGALLRVPWTESPNRLAPMEDQYRLREVFEKQNRLLDMLEVSYVGSLNKAIDTGGFPEIVRISEAVQEKEIASIATEIATQHETQGIRIVMVAGPSSSGKTTFTKRLRTQLLVNYLKPHQISLDNYFVDREETPLDAQGRYDFEHIDALDLETFGHDLRRLLSGERIEMPVFDFTHGKRVYSNEYMQIGENDVILIEGIHALNPRLIPEDLRHLTYNVYISALTVIGLDAHNRIPSTDIRLLRRMVRDSKYRGYSAIDTIRRWPSVREGERKWVFPFQHRANAMFNSAMMYEVAALKPFAEHLLYQVPACVPEYSEARRLLRFLEHVRPASIEMLPHVSLLREFLGGSSFSY